MLREGGAVTYSLSGLTSKATAFAMSDVVPQRPKGHKLANPFSIFSIGISG